MRTFADKLLAASEDAGLSPEELRRWMRRAALQILHLQLHGLTAEYRAMIDQARADAGETPLTVEAPISDWVTRSDSGAVQILDDDTETKGSA